jgi:DNA repair and recombination protein RAD52
MLSNLPPNVDLVSAPPQPGRAPYKPASVSTDNRPPQTPNHGQKRPSPPAATHVAPMSRPALGAQPRPSGHNPPAVHNPAAAQQNNASVSVGFFSAKAVKDLPASALEDESSTQFAMPRGNQLFNPKLESPSIPKTPGIDHSSSKPLSRNGQHVAPTLSQSSGPEAKTGGFTPVRPSAAPPARGAVLNQSLDQTRRIGAPGAPGSPLTNRSQYRPPTMKRTLPGEAGGAGQQQRSPLQELPANGGGNANTTVTDGLEAKRQKVL